MKYWKTLSSRNVYSNPWITVREDAVIRPDGEEGIYGVVEGATPGVIVVPIDTTHHVYLTLQERYTIGTESWELPAGGTDGEDYETAARRELLEESGLEATHLSRILSLYPLIGVSNHMLHIYIATGLTQTTNQLDASDGILATKKVSLADAEAMIFSGQITDGASVAGILAASAHIKLKRS